jgi:ABC-type branched-subunit amino acid transport system substrate-binding protein
MLLALGYTAYVWKQPAPIRIAFANSLTGPTSSPGAEILAAIKLYIDEVNRTGGVSQGDRIWRWWLKTGVAGGGVAGL